MQSVPFHSHMTMFLRHVHHNKRLLLIQSLQSLSTVLRSPPDFQSKQFGRQSYASMPSLTQLLPNIYASRSSAGLQEVSCPLLPHRPFLKKEPLLPPWIDIPRVHKGMSSECSAGKCKDTHGINALKITFVKHIRPFLVSRCVLLTKPLHDNWVKCLHVMTSKLIGHTPVYVTSLDLMRCLRTLHSIYWTDILNMLVAERVMVVEDWERSLTPVEWMVYDYGMQFAPQIGDDDLVNCKAEYAALFQKKCRTATIASVIWKSRKIIDCQVNHGITCSTYGEAQSIALHNVLTRGGELGISNIDVVTDVALHDKVLKGTRGIDKTPYPHICMAIIQAAKHYKICRSRLEPSEMLSLVSTMAKSKNMEQYELEDMLEAKGSHFTWGLPFFRIAQKKSMILPELEVNSCGLVTFPTNCYIEVPEEAMKLDALAGILPILDARLVIVLTDSSDSASEVQSVMRFSYECCTLDNTSHVDVNESTHEGLTGKYSAMIFIDRFEIPPIEAEKFLVIVFDAPKGPLHFSANQNRANILVVNIITPSEKASVSDSEEVNPMLYGFFRSYGGTDLHQDGPTGQLHS